MLRKSIWLVRARRWVRLWVKIAAEGCLAPLHDRTAFLQLLALPVFFYLVFLAQGIGAVTEEIFFSWAAAKALAYAVPVFLLWNFIGAMFRVKEVERMSGKWFGGSFVYNEPILVHISRVTNADNEALQPFKIKEAEPGGYVYLNVEFDGFEKRRIKAQVVHKYVRGISLPGPMPWEAQQDGPFHCAVLIEKEKTLYLATHCETENWSIVKIYLVSFSIT